MSSSTQSNNSTKSASLTKSTSNLSQHSATTSAANAFFSSGGLGPATSKTSATPRNQQSAKSKHKQSKRFRLADEDAFAESAAMQSANSRKGQTSITHLMSFSLPPRPQHQHQHRFNNGRGGNARRNPTWGLGSGYHAVDKARYVHANYRFVVDPRGDYHAQAIDADIHLDWNNILQILVSSKSQQASCPICLGDPTAPRMAKCGHIFCLPCLIRYMHSEDPTFHPSEKRPRWKKCPICEDAIYTTDTRPVRWYEGQEADTPREGTDVVLRLVKRSANSTLAMPRESPEVVAKSDDVPWYFAAEVMDYARITKGSEDYMIEQFDSDISAIRQLEQEDELMFGEDSEWTGRAIKLLEEAKIKVRGIGHPPASVLKPSDKPSQRQIIPTIDTSIEGDTSTANGSESLLSTRLADFNKRQHIKPPPEQYFFYQALLHYYLSPLDIRILRDAFGSYDSFPSSILPRIERVSQGHIVDDELRKRIKYLGHLPYGCEVGFLECDWTDTVPADILERYKGDLERRRKRNNDKEAREEKERQRAERAEDKEFAAARRRRTQASNDKFNENDFLPLGPATNSLGQDHLSVGVASGAAGSPPWAESMHRNHSSGFASLATPGTSPNNIRTVWGTAAVPLTSPELRALPRDDPVDDGWLQDWERDLLHHEDHLVAQVAAASLDERGEQSISASAGSGKGGKKKNKKITLMSTTARRGA